MTATTLLTTTDIARIVAVHGLPAVLSRMVDYLEADYRRWQAFEKTGQYRFTPPVLSCDDGDGARLLLAHARE